jgi:hypothetical protein
VITNYRLAPLSCKPDNEMGKNKTKQQNNKTTKQQNNKTTLSNQML